MLLSQHFSIAFLLQIVQNNSSIDPALQLRYFERPQNLQGWYQKAYALGNAYRDHDWYRCDHLCKEHPEVYIYSSCILLMLFDKQYVVSTNSFVL